MVEQVKVVVMAAYVTEVVQNLAKFVGKVIVETTVVCVHKVVGVVLVGVQLVQHVGVVLSSTTGVKHNTMDTVVLFVMHVIIVGKPGIWWRHIREGVKSCVTLALLSQTVTVLTIHCIALPECLVNVAELHYSLDDDNGLGRWSRNSLNGYQNALNSLFKNALWWYVLVTMLERC